MEPAVWGFGSWILESQGFLCAKAERFGVEILMPCANALCQGFFGCCPRGGGGQAGGLVV